MSNKKKEKKRLRRLKVVNKYFIFGFSKAFNITAAQTDETGEFFFPTIVTGDQDEQETTEAST